MPGFVLKRNSYQLDISQAELESEIEKWTSRATQAEKEVDALSKKMEILKQSLNRVKLLLSEKKANVEAVQHEKQDLEAELNQYEQIARRTIGRSILDFAPIDEQKRQATERVDAFEKLIQRTLTLERALDSTQREALLAELDLKAQGLTKHHLVILKKTRRMSEIRKWFTKVRDVLDYQVSDAVTNHVRALVPLTTILQKRLRAAYGFGDISLHAKGSEVLLDVSWRDISLKPTDYFSDSLKQVLMLSLFLASRLTQTWSGFAPILMDDPVTHFDYINAFGFVELIRGLANTFPRRRQFLISTCEDRLFRLMRKKFRSIHGGAKFYRFEGISSNDLLLKRGGLENDIGVCP